MERKNIAKKQGLDNKKTNLYAIFIGSISGFINGVFGGGGGMVVVPLLTYLLKRENKKAHATAILIILPLSILSSFFYALFGNFELVSGIPTGIGVIIGGVIGALVLKKLSSKCVCIIFSIVMFGAGVKLALF